MNATIKVGIFMFVVLVLAGGLILKIEDLRFGGKSAIRSVDAIFATVAGLDEKSAVRVAGIRVGKVDRILLEGKGARCVLRIDDPKVELHADAKAKIVAMGLLGDKYIELDPGTMTAPLLPAGQAIGGVVPTAISDLGEIAGDIGKDLKEVTSSLKGSIGGPEGEKRVFEIVENIRELTASLRDILRDNRQGVNTTVDNFAAFSADLRKEVPKVAEQIRILSEKLNVVIDENRSGLKDGISNVRELAEKLKTSADNLNKITTKIEKGEGTIGKLVNDDSAHDKLTKALDSVSAGADTLTKALGKIGNTRFDLGFESAYFPSTEKSRSAFTMDITPKDSRRFYKVDVVALPYGKRKEKTETITTTFPDGHSETIEITKTKYDDQYGITANVGYHLSDELAVRGGLIEGRGGVAADYDALGKKLRVSMEAFDFDRKKDDSDPESAKRAHFRLSGRWRFTDNLFLLGGFDDPLLKDNRSVFLGGGLTWTDDDIKYLIGSVPMK